MADAVDLITLDEAKAALNISGTTFDTEIAMYVTAVSQAIDELCGPVVARNVTEEHDGGTYSLWLYEAPVLSVTTVTEYDDTTATVLTAETNTAKTSTQYRADLEAGRLRRRSNNLPERFACGAGNIVVAYSAGRYASTSAVAPRFKLAASIMLSTNWRVEQGAGTSTFGAFATGEPVFGSTFAIPNKVRELLYNDLRGPLSG